MYKQMRSMLHLSVCLGPVDNNTFYKIKAIPVNIKLLKEYIYDERDSYSLLMLPHDQVYFRYC